MTTFGVIDLGSNSIRLVIYDVDEKAFERGHRGSVKSIIDDKVMAGLASYVVDGAFTEAGMKKAVSVLKEHAQRAEYFHCKELRVFATAVIRNASNRDEAIETLRRETGLTIDLLSGADEAHLGFIGASWEQEIAHGLLVDIGGGSTELTQIKSGNDVRSVSIPQGSLSSFTRYVENILPTASEAACIGEVFDAKLPMADFLDECRGATVYALGGSPRAVSKMIAQMDDSPVRQKILQREDALRVIDLCRTDKHRFARLALLASAERLHTLTPGAIILNRILNRIDADHVVLCKRGIREGYLMERILETRLGNAAEHRRSSKR